MEISFTDRELDVMNVLWERGPSTVAEVREKLEDDLAYTTVLTILRVLEGKGHVGHEEEGRAHRYRPLVAREDARRSAVGGLLQRFFAGSPEQVLLHLVAEKNVSDEDLRKMRELLDHHLEREEGK